VVAGLAVGPEVLHVRHHDREQRREQLLQVVADEEVLLAGLADHGRRPDRVLAVGERFDVEHGIVVLQE
jgi:hypothetical protein